MIPLAKKVESEIDESALELLADVNFMRLNKSKCITVTKIFKNLKFQESYFILGAKYINTGIIYDLGTCSERKPVLGD